MVILFENRALVVCVKPAGVQSEDTASAACMPALLREHWGRADAPVFCVHRLDTATGGVMVFAKTKAAAAALSAQIAGGEMKKAYFCVCAGVPEPAKGEMHDFLFKDSRKNKVFPVKSARKGAKEALLSYEVLAVTAPNPPRAAQTPAALPQTLCRVSLGTGRTHQIRVQFASRKHPLLGDGKYGSRVKGALGLWCCSLCFTVPGETIPRVFYAAPPAEGAWTDYRDVFAKFSARDTGEI